MLLMLWFYGREKKRDKRTEYTLLSLVKKGAIKEARWGRPKVYAVRGSTQHIEHGLACAEGLVRVVRSDNNCVVIGENQLSAAKLGCVSEWITKYPNDTMLAYEHCTRDNATRSGMIPRKVNQYGRYLWRIEEAFEAKAVVLFVIELPREAVRRMALKYGSYFYTDYETFLKVPLGQQLTAPIYIWGENGQEYPLKKHD